MAEEEVDEQKLLALLGFIADHQFYDKRIENGENALKSEHFATMSMEQFNRLTDRMSQLLRSMASSDMDFNQLDAFLTSQMKRREGKISENQAKCLQKFWKSHKSSIHDSLIARSTFNPTLKSLKWRIDVPTHAKSDKSSNSPVAIVELKLSQQIKDEKAKLGTVHLELNDSDIAKLLQSLDEIDAELNDFCNK